MNFLKQSKEYLLEQIKGSISNSFHFSIKDLYKKDPHKINNHADTLDCLNCGVLLSCNKCLYCGHQHDQGINQNTFKNWSATRECEHEDKSVQCMILMVDLSGSMNCTYPSKYKKTNKQYVIRAIGLKNYQTIKNAIGQLEVIKHFKGIQTLLESGESIRDIALSFKEQIQREKKTNSKKTEVQKAEEYQYISRKEIIQVGISQYINAIKSKRPHTLITVVYFNSHIEFPINNFAECKVIGNLNEMTLEDILEAGRIAASQISLSTIQQVGDKLLSNMTKAEASGQTALTPALAFCLGMTSKWKHDLNQIVIVTDGLSNVGIGQTEQQDQLSQSKVIYERLAVQQAVKYNCVVNIISFEDCSIGYDVIDEIIKRTGGVPYCIGFTQQNKQKIVNGQTISFLNFQMTNGFCQSTKKFCFDNKLAVKISNPNIKIIVPEQMKPALKINEGNWVSMDLGVKSVNQSFQFGFAVEQNFSIKKQIPFKVTVLHQYRRSNNISFIVREQLLKIKPGNKQEAVKSQASVLKHEIQKKLKTKFEEDNFQDYQNIAKKLQRIQIVQSIDKHILQKFNVKKASIEDYDKNVDKISKDKRAIESRRKQTYNRRKYSEEDIFE